MLDPNSQIGEIFEKGQSTTQGQVGDIAKRVKGQVLGGDKKTPAKTSQADNQNASQQKTETVASEDRTKEVVKDFYSPTEQTTTPVKPVGESDPEKIEKIRKQLADLHNTTYYDPLFAYEHKKEEPTKQEEKEKEEKEKMQDLQIAKDKKAQDIAVQMASQKTERYPGMSG
jgi:hypothetical protein